MGVQKGEDAAVVRKEGVAKRMTSQKRSEHVPRWGKVSLPKSFLSFCLSISFDVIGKYKNTKPNLDVTVHKKAKTIGAFGKG